MKKLLIYCLAAFWFFVAAQPLHARGGGGCLIQGTLILTPKGNVPVERLKPGDAVVGVSRGSIKTAVVRSVTAVAPDTYLRIMVNNRINLYVTPEHPIEIKFGVFRMASALKVGDPVHIADGTRLLPGKVTSITREPASSPAYNLLVSPAGNYIANGIVVHNKGCFLPDTLIRKADGSDIAISRIRKQDQVLAMTADGHVVKATVRKVLVHTVKEYRVVTAGDIILRVTNEHPFYVGSGTFMTLEALKVDDAIFIFNGRGLISRRIEGIKTIRKKARVYNLQTDAPHTFFANGVFVHNKGGGCFPAGTKISTPLGDVPIEKIRPGVPVISVDYNGAVLMTLVEKTYATRGPLVLVRTSSGPLRATAEHPLALAAGGFRPAGELAPGDEVMTFSKGEVRQATVKEVQKTNITEDVYNLTVERPRTFVADGFVVHNKGGGGGGFRGGGFSSRSSRSSGTSSGGSGENFFVAFFAIGLVIVVVVIILARKNVRDKNLDYLYTQTQIGKKRDKTIKLLAFIAKQDQTVAPESLRKHTKSTFLKLQKCWQAREYGPMKPLMMPDLYNEHLLQIQGMLHNHEINMIESLTIDRIDLVNVRYTLKEDQREFTALITATAKDYYIDDRTKSRLRGDEAPAQFQEFRTFHYHNRSWLLREIEQTAESDILKEDNLFEQFTDRGLEHVYGDTGAKEGPAGPWLEKAVETKETRIERMLNFLVKTDKLWDRAAMLRTARNVFIKTTVAWESGDPTKVPVGDLFPEVADSLRKEITNNRDAKITLEFRNLCVRKTELLLVKNYADNTKDEFVVRVRAHAQKIMARNNAPVRRDDEVTAFEQYLTFGRLDNQWKLKEVLNAAAAQGVITLENIDQDSSPQQLQWYYQHKRAI